MAVIFLCVESVTVVPRPDVPALAVLVPAVVESFDGAIAAVVSIFVLVVLVSTVEGAVMVAEESVVVVLLLSVPLLQAARLPAIAMIANTFFMFVLLYWVL